MKKEEEQRKADLLAIVGNLDEEKQLLAIPLVDELLFLEGQLQALKKLPFIKVNPSNPALQKQTEAARQYSKLSAAYLQTVKTISKIIGNTGNEDDGSILSEWLKATGAMLNASAND